MTSCQRIAVTALALVPVVMVTAATLPALVVLPLLPDGAARASALIDRLQRWTATILTSSR
ncbi:hypothetical protein [Kitasatospora sp. NPDC057936]|uniref:hypothetical protein n=1 Tax=Kitasatospora sp. NPDC057936 TaxID=3346283 RepID=UPI0036DCBD07